MNSEQVVSHSGATYRQIDYWCRMGYLGESYAAELGSGIAREFDWGTAEIVRNAVSLIALGFETTAALSLARRLREDKIIIFGKANVTVSVTRA